MGIRQGKSLNHWNYFLVIESDIEEISRYIEPTKQNSKTYSQELARILMASSSEVDVLLKGICAQLHPQGNADSIGKYESVLRSDLPKFFKFKVHIPRWGLTLTPWKSWKANNPPDWWTACNKIKHHRDTEYHRANLKNTLDSVAAMFICNLYFHKELAETARLLPLQRLIRVDDKYFDGTTDDGLELGINYAL